VYNFVFHVRRSLASGEDVTALIDAVISPTYVPDLVHASLDLFIDEESGIWHLANEGAVSWYELAQMVARLTGGEPSKVIGVPIRDANLKAQMPKFSALGSERGWIMPPLDNALERFIAESAAR
jgi:dTDP-4-dehydrorhamnose reductase